MIPHHFFIKVNVSPSLRGGLQADEAISEIASASFGTLPRNDDYPESGGG